MACHVLTSTYQEISHAPVPPGTLFLLDILSNNVNVCTGTLAEKHIQAAGKSPHAYKTPE
jgi:hypothetical protein